MTPLAVVAALVVAPQPTHAQPPRWPTWPTQVDRIADILGRDAKGKEVSGERERVAAMQQLDRFATGAILDPLLVALEDDSAQVRRDALRMCFEREIVACIPGAEHRWEEGGEPTVRVAALKVLALDPQPSRVAILIDALRDPSEVIRAQAADFLGSAPLGPTMRGRARAALLAKLADVSAVVRRRAVLSLGLLGPGEGTLSIARLLDDTEPSVQSAAAEALGHYRDPTAVPALRRAIASPHDPQVSLAFVEALAVLPDPAVEADLLGLFDDPPNGLDEWRVGQALGRRPQAGPALLNGLVDRLDEPARRDAALGALLLFGEQARPFLEEAVARGLAPSIDIEVRRLLVALEPVVHSTPLEHWPAADDRPAWRDRIELRDPYTRTQAAWALVQLDPAWRVPTALAALATPGPLAGRESWALVLAGSHSRWSAPADDEARARLEGWARDRSASRTSRCLAVAALGARAPDDGAREAPAWADLAEEPDDHVRACAALALGRQGDLSRLPGLLVDDRGRVRLAAALALALVEPRRLHRATRARLALLAHRDPDPAVRAAAHRVLAGGPGDEPRPDAPGLFLTRAEPYPWRDPPRLLEVEDAGAGLWLPAEGSGAWRWALVPGLARAQAKVAVIVPSTSPNPGQAPP